VRNITRQAGSCRKTFKVTLTPMTRLNYKDIKALIFKLIRFGIVGLSAVIIYAIAAYLLTSKGGIKPVLASPIAYLIAIPVSFFGQKYFTFASKGKAKTEASFFIILQLCSLAIATGLTAFTTEVLGWHSNWAIVVVCLILPPASYFIMSLYIFTNPSKHSR